MVNLVRLLVDQGVLTADKGSALMRQAQAEADRARATQQTALAAAAPGGLPAPAPGTIRVPYVPPTVRDQIKAELRTEVMQTARAEGWASPDGAAPDWTRRITLNGDVRVRSQSVLYSKTNSDQILDFARINAQGPFDVSGLTPFPYLNTREDRINQLQLRARLGLTVKVSDRIEAGFQIASGDSNTPISLNASLGGGLGQRDVWLQYAYLTVRPTDWALISAGRFRNPFRSTELVFDEDLAFDGVAATIDVGQALGDDFGLKLTGGAFPLDFGDPDYPSTRPTKTSFPQKYLFSGEILFDTKFDDFATVRLAAAYHSFSNIQGELSEPCLVGENVVDCSTDGTRPTFLGKGNTLSYLRLDATRPGAPDPLPLQFFGLTFDYDILDVRGEVEFALDDEVKATIGGNYVRNLGFKRSAICRNGVFGEPFNNGGSEGGSASICDGSNTARFLGGNEGYQGSIRLGHHDVWRKGQWSVEGGYRYVQTDAVLDSLSDSDFHFGGTNAKGYFLAGRYSLYDNTSIGARWLSANEIVGDPLSIDVLFFDIEAKF